MSEPLFTSEPELTDRQAHALDLIRRYEPIRSDDLGAHMHAWKLGQGFRGHTVTATCDWCTSEGKSVGDALTRKGLVRYVRGHGWVTAGWRPPLLMDEQSSSQLGPDAPFPEGF